MQSEVKKHLHDILQAVSDIEEFVGKTGFDEFSQSRLLQAAVERKFEVTGEP